MVFLFGTSAQRRYDTSSAPIVQVLSVSSHTSRANYPDFYYAQLQLLAKYGNGIRFYEGRPLYAPKFIVSDLKVSIMICRVRWRLWHERQGRV
jgi:hypothetical protein